MRDIYALSPINGTAKNVISQKNITPYTDIGREDMVQIINLLSRKHRLLKHVLGIKSKRQHSNLMSRYNRNSRKVSGHKHPRALSEYVFVGAEIQKFTRLLEEMRRARVSSPQPTLPQPETNCPKIDGSKLSAHDQVTRDEFDQEAM